jgi:hypothetical protein
VARGDRTAQLRLRVDHEISLRHDTFAILQPFEDFNSFIADSSGIHGPLFILARGILHVDDRASAVAQHGRPWNDEAFAQVGRDIRLGIGTMRKNARKATSLAFRGRVVDLDTDLGAARPRSKVGSTKVTTPSNSRPGTVGVLNTAFCPIRISGRSRSYTSA